MVVKTFEKAPKQEHIQLNAFQLISYEHDTLNTPSKKPLLSLLYSYIKLEMHFCIFLTTTMETTDVT